MGKKNNPKILTANDLLEGHSVYFSAAGEWVTDYHSASIASTPEETAALEAKGREAEAANRVVGAYLVDIAITADGRPEPTHFREIMRVKARPSYWGESGEHHGGKRK